MVEAIPLVRVYYLKYHPFSLVQYFRALLSMGDNFKLKGMPISTYEIITANSVRAERNCSCKQCCAVVPYVNY